MMEALKATVRDVALAALAAFAGALSVGLAAEVTLPGFKAVLVAAGWAALRAAVGVAAARFAK